MFDLGLGSILSGAAVVIALAILFYGLARRSQMLADLAKLESSLNSANALLNDIHSSDEFFERFDQISEDLAAVPVLRPHWNAFQRSLIRSNERGVIGSPTSAGDTFNYDLLYSPELHLRRHEAMPNQLVGIGLLGTFIGLALSLWIASSGLQVDVETAKRSLIALMSASAIKFVTSIAAIFVALLFTHSKNAKLAQLHPSIEDFAARIDWLVRPMSREQLAEESHRELVAQTRHMEARNDELARTIASELNATLQISLKEAIAPVAEEINGMAEKMGEISENTMRYMVDMFAKELGSAAKEHSERMAALLNEVSRAVEKVPANIELSSGAFSDAMAASAKVIEQTFGAASSHLTKSLEQASERMAASAKSWSDISDKLIELTDGLSATQDAFGERLDAVHDTTAQTIVQLNALAREMEHAAANLPAMDVVAGQLESAAKALELSVTEIGKLEHIGEDARQRANAATEQFMQTVATIERDMKALDGSMAAVFSRTSDGLSAFQKQTEGFVGSLDTQMAHAVQLLTEAVDKLASSNGQRGSVSEAAE